MQLNFKNIAILILVSGILNSCASSAVTVINRDDGSVSLISHEGNFSALMPEKPRRSVKKSASKIGDLHNFIYTCMINKDNINYVFLISYVDYPANMIQSTNSTLLIRNAVIGSMKRLGNPRLITEKAITIQNNPGHEAIFTGYQNITGKLVMAKERIYLVKNRMFILLMMTEATNSHNIADKFFNSFQLTTNI